MKIRPMTLSTSTLRPSTGLDQRGAAAGRTGGIVQGANEPGLPVDEDEGFTLVEGVVAERHGIGARREDLGTDRLGDAGAPGGVLAVHHDAIEGPAGPKVRQFGRDRGPARTPHDVTDEEDSRITRVRMS